MSCSSCQSPDCCGCNACADVAACDPNNEPLSSALDNFITSFYGSLTKTCVNDKVVWVLPCNLDTGFPAYPRIAGEGLACYFLRVFAAISSAAKVVVDGSDTTPGNLADKISAGSGVTLSITNPGGNETLQISISATTLATINSAVQLRPSLLISASNIDWSTADGFFKTLSANTVFTFSNTFDCKSIVVALTNTAGNFTATWPVAVQWANGSDPVLTLGAKTDVFTFVKINGIVYGSVVQNMS